jgi:hypothetical protein
LVGKEIQIDIELELVEAAAPEKVARNQPQITLIMQR